MAACLPPPPLPRALLGSALGRHRSAEEAEAAARKALANPRLNLKNTVSGRKERRAAPVERRGVAEQYGAADAGVRVLSARDLEHVAMDPNHDVLVLFHERVRRDTTGKAGGLRGVLIGDLDARRKMDLYRWIAPLFSSSCRLSWSPRTPHGSVSAHSHPCPFSAPQGSEPCAHMAVFFKRLAERLEDLGVLAHDRSASTTEKDAAEQPATETKKKKTTTKKKRSSKKHKQAAGSMSEKEEKEGKAGAVVGVVGGGGRLIVARMDVTDEAPPAHLKVPLKSLPALLLLPAHDKAPPYRFFSGVSKVENWVERRTREGGKE